MGSGGARPGAGRKPGSTNVKTQEVAARLLADGRLTPLEVLVDTMHYYREQADADLAKIAALQPGDDPQSALDLLKQMQNNKDKMVACAENAAGYMHSRAPAAIAVLDVAVGESTALVPKSPGQDHLEDLRKRYSAQGLTVIEGGAQG